MIRAAGALAAGLALAVACAPRGHLTSPETEHRATTYYARLAATASGDVRARLSGLLAVAPDGRLRLEIPGPGASVRLILVANEADLTLTLGAEALHYAGPPQDPLLGSLFGIPLPAAAAVSLVTKGKGDLPGRCESRARRYRRIPGGGKAPSRITIRCDASRLALRLSGFQEILPEARHTTFLSLAPPPGYRTVGREEILRALAGLAEPASE